MGISCSLKGHQWGDPETETETLEKEGGSIQIKRKLRTCIKCDEVEVLKQQKVARKTMTDKNNSNERQPEVAADGGSFEPESNDEGVVIMGDDDDEETSATDESTVETQTTHTEDDLDAGAFDAKRDIEDVGPEGQSEHDESNSPDRDYDGIVPESEENNVELLGTPDDADQQSTTQEYSDEETGRSPSSPSDAQVTHTDESSTSWKDKEVESGEAKLVCPDCGFSAPLDDVPVYSGDACPECRRGYLQEK